MKKLLTILFLAVLVGCKTKPDFSNYKTGALPLDSAEVAKIPFLVMEEVSSATGVSAAIPSIVRLTPPRIVYQGSEGNCSATAFYYARSIEQYYRTGATSYTDSTNTFSPEFIFNPIKSGLYCDGTGLLQVLGLLRDKGVCTWAKMPWIQNDCNTLPNADQYANAANYKITGYSKVLASDIGTIKSILASNKPLVSQYSIDDNFRNGAPDYIWNSFSGNPGFHALCIVGYDDTKNAFLIVNSWGTEFGDNGYRWIDYSFLAIVSSGLFVMNFDAVPPPCPTSGTLIRTECINYDKWGVYVNESCVEYKQLIKANDPDCGYVPPVVDVTAPVVTISSPADGFRVTKFIRTVNISASATDNVGVTSMSISLNGVVKASCSTGSCSYSWNTKFLAAGTYTITVTAKDKAGNIGTKSITVKK
jgi:hypothetical protein